MRLGARDQFALLGIKPKQNAMPGIGTWKLLIGKDGHPALIPGLALPADLATPDPQPEEQNRADDGA